MNQKKTLSFLVCAVLFLFSFTGNAAAVDLFDGKLVLHGKWTNQILMRAKGQEPEPAHNYDFFNVRTSLKLEALWHAYEGPNFNINVYSIWKNFYDGAVDLDSGYRNNLEHYNIGRKGIERARTYETFRDICRELYIDVTTDNFQVRLGKQIISWGESSFERMVDNINPVDINGDLNNAYPDFGELKRGLWMLRVFFTPENMPADMTFEMIVIPDFQTSLLPPIGHHLTLRGGAQFFSPAKVGEVYESWYRDVPSNWKTPEIGFRVRGFTLGFDWTVSYFHHRLRSGDPLEKEYDSILTQIMRQVNNSAMTGKGRLKHNVEYPWQSTFGVTFNKTIDMKIPIIPGTGLAMSGNVLRFEGIWEKDRDNVRLASDYTSASHQEKDRFAVCFGWDTKIYVPWLTPWARQEHLQSSTQLFMEWSPKKHRNDYIYPYVTYRRKGHSWQSVTQSLFMEFWHGRIIPAVYTAYHITEGGGYIAPTIAFKPQFGWTIMLRYMDYHDYSEGLDEKDFWTFEVTYEF